MRNGDILILKGQEVKSLLAGRELDLINVVRMAYTAHARGESCLPHSLFLRFPDDQKNRIIALPAYLGADFNVAGIKWVSSFPANLDLGLERASAVVILNSTVTGRPEAIIEGATISAKRTAASAALAARCLHTAGKQTAVGLVGCGLINFEIVRFLLASQPGINRVTIFDLDASRANQFKDKCRSLTTSIPVDAAKDLDTVLRRSSLISVATTAIKPHILDLSVVAPNSTILNISLRDFGPEVLLGCDNVVDDIDHVCRAETSIHLAEKSVNNRNFIRCTLADIIRGEATARSGSHPITIFSPFGLGILDLAVAKLVRDLANERGHGAVISSFLSDSYTDAKQAASD